VKHVLFVQVMLMDEDLFRDHQEKEGWSDADEDAGENDQLSLSFSKFLSRLTTA